MVAYFSKLSAKPALRVGNLTYKNLLSYTPNLAIWGGSTFAAIFVFTENWPTFQDALYKNIPVFGTHWQKSIPPEDSPN